MKNSLRNKFQTAMLTSRIFMSRNQANRKSFLGTIFGSKMTARTSRLRVSVNHGAVLLQLAALVKISLPTFFLKAETYLLVGLFILIKPLKRSVKVKELLVTPREIIGKLL